MSAFTDKFSERLNAALEMRNMKAAELSRKTNIPAAVISQYRSGRYKPMQDRVDIISKALNVSPAWLMGLSDTEIDFSRYGLRPVTKKRVPLLGNIPCGEPKYADEDIECYVEIGNDVKADFCLRAKGDSMIGARIHDGDLVFIRSMPQVDNGRIAAVIIDDEATLKRVYYYPENNMMILKPENSKYKDLIYVGQQLETVRILGLAVGLWTETF